MNHAPSLHTDSPLDYDIKKHVVDDAIGLLNVNQERREKFIRERNELMAERMMNKKVQKMGVEEREKLRQQKLEERFNFERMRIN